MQQHRRFFITPLQGFCKKLYLSLKFQTMKKALFTLAVLPVLFLLAGCPVGLDYPLGTPGTEKINKALIGKWSQENTDMEVMRMEIEKLNDYTLKLTVTERGSMYAEESDIFKGWCTTIENQQFLYFQEIDSSAAQYYHYAYKFDGDKLVTYDMSLLDGGVDAVTSTAALREQVAKSMKMDEFLSSEAIWTKE